MLRFSTGFRDSITLGIAGIATLMDGGFIRIYGGDRPAHPDEGSGLSPHLATITTDGLPYVQGSGNGAGLRVQFRSPGILTNYGNWVVKGRANGTATWWRWFWSGPETFLESSYYPRVDGAVGQDCSMRMSNTTITPSTQFILKGFVLIFPES